MAVTMVVGSRDTEEHKSVGCSEQLFMARIEVGVLGTDLRDMTNDDLRKKWRKIRMRFGVKTYNLYCQIHFWISSEFTTVCL